MEKAGVKLVMRSKDLSVLKENTVDSISFSYYASRLTSADPGLSERTASSMMASMCNPHPRMSE